MLSLLRLEAESTKSSQGAQRTPKNPKSTDSEVHSRRREEAAVKRRRRNVRQEWETSSTINKMPATQLPSFLLKYEGNIKHYSLILLRNASERDSAAYLLFKPPLRRSNAPWSNQDECGEQIRKSALFCCTKNRKAGALLQCSWYTLRWNVRRKNKAGHRSAGAFLVHSSLKCSEK
jgi:hypothetical protein